MALTRLGSVSSPTAAKSRHNRPGYLVDTNIAAEKITIMTKTKYQVCVRTSSCRGTRHKAGPYEREVHKGQSCPKQVQKNGGHHNFEPECF